MKQQYNKLQFIKDKQINETTKQQQLIILLIFQMNLQFIVYSFAKIMDKYFIKKSHTQRTP